MGLWSWFFPSPEDRVRKARELLAAQRWADARQEVEGVDHPDAAALLAEACVGLARVNLAHAVSWAEANDEARVAMHLELAEELAPRGAEADFREARRQIREKREARRAEEQRKKAEEEARLLSVDPLGFSGGRSLLQAPLDPSNADPDAEERAQRLALLIESYPAALRAGIPALGPDFAQAVLDLDDGRPDLALPALALIGDDAPLVRWERARAAYALNDVRTAIEELRAFATLAGGHATIGTQHSGVWLAQILAEQGDVDGGLRLLRDLRATSPNMGSLLFAQLLEVKGELAEAEDVLRRLIAQAPKADIHYLLLARVRLAGGHREPAKAALEQAMLQVCDSRGCSHKPPNADVVRSLAVLYLEDSSDVRRGLELAEQSAALPKQGTSWEDVYLAALAAQRASAPGADELIDRLWELTPDDHPNRLRLAQYLPEAA